MNSVLHWPGIWWITSRSSLCDKRSVGGLDADAAQGGPCAASWKTNTCDCSRCVRSSFGDQLEEHQ